MIVGEGNKTIEPSKYYFNETLKNVIISEDVEHIEEWAFGYCINLKRIFITKNISYISPNAFDGCENLEEISVDEQNEFFASVDGVLYSKNYEILIRVPSNYHQKRFVINDMVMRLEELSFNRCTNLREIVFPPKLKKIGEKAFAYCENIEKVIVPNTIEEIGDYAFSDCYSLKKFQVENECYHSQDDVLYETKNGKKILVQFPLGKKQDEYWINNRIYGVKDRAFIGAKFLSNIHVENNPCYCSKDGILYETKYRRLVCVPTKKDIEILVLPENVQIIGNSSIKMNNNLRKIIFPKKLNYIERHAIENCVGLLEVELTGNDLKVIEWSAFWGCYSLQQIDLSKQKNYLLIV